MALRVHGRDHSWPAQLAPVSHLPAARPALLPASAPLAPTLDQSNRWGNALADMPFRVSPATRWLKSKPEQAVQTFHVRLRCPRPPLSATPSTRHSGVLTVMAALRALAQSAIRTYPPPRTF